MTVERMVLGRPIRAEVTRLDEGIHVLLVGGERTHMGAISVAEPGGAVETRVFPGHKDQFLSEPWAAAIAEKMRTRTVALCGIHYDNATKGQIEEILAAGEGMLAEILEKLGKEAVAP